MCLIFFSCHLASGKKERGNAVERIEIERYDKVLNEYVEFNSFSALKKLNTEYLQETKYLIEDVLRLGQVNDDKINTKLKEFYSDSTLRMLTTDALRKFSDMNRLEKGFKKGFKKLKKEIPALKIPHIYSQISALNESVVVGDSILGFSIDKYMGEDYMLYKRYFYDYQRKSMKPDRILPDCFSFFLFSEYPFPENNKGHLLDVMLYYAKVHYVVSKILEYKSFGEELNYTKHEEEWCKFNSKNIWGYMLQNGHLNSTDPMIIRKYLKQAPNTAFFGDNSPMMTGVWMGMQIVDSYMKNHKNMTLKELLEMNDYTRMLSESRFNP
ncbi:gliding motility lipoprotein GldB [Bacteroides sedimenti]|uniref:Gliding motility lipoprotein GldB n=2 Tax=Bacteroides sedimenti TaxID=2136147 RepID=A0ABM8I907_9BACE